MSILSDAGATNRPGWKPSS